MKYCNSTEILLDLKNLTATCEVHSSLSQLTLWHLPIPATATTISGTSVNRPY